MISRVESFNCTPNSGNESECYSHDLQVTHIKPNPQTGKAPKIDKCFVPPQEIMNASVAQRNRRAIITKMYPRSRRGG